MAWNPARIAEAPGVQLFDPRWWRDQKRLVGEAEGRGAAYFLDGLDGTPWVLRHNRRGGVLAHLNHDRFIWTGASRARALAELRLLARMHADGLPVPVPIAALAARRGPVYRSDVVTERIAGARPLADVLMEKALPATAWQALGGAVARFHRAGIRHADLNARNVLVDSDLNFHLIDFDKAKRVAPGAWREPNLARLRRSLDKFDALTPTFNFAEADWAALRGGYAEVFASGH
ncbi:3-deoxy-D-manno-octulosonic acid kinase [Salinisphaera aquimarina]|uniref:3-deoxy-D-manno-octulosonic acid kinase n=1 Tax=Salinisphaera aquimarina TaxID=2094031 RepID=A0ABV7EQ65_9GAMM